MLQVYFHFLSRQSPCIYVQFYMVSFFRRISSGINFMLISPSLWLILSNLYSVLQIQIDTPSTSWIYLLTTFPTNNHHIFHIWSPINLYVIFHCLYLYIHPLGCYWFVEYIFSLFHLIIRCWEVDILLFFFNGDFFFINFRHRLH